MSKSKTSQTAPTNGAPPQLAIVQLSDLRALLVDIVNELMPDQYPALVDRAGLARALSVSVSKLDELRRLPGFPTVHLGPASERYEIPAVVAFLRTLPAPVGDN